MPDDTYPLKPDITKPISEERKIATSRRRGTDMSGGPYTILYPPEGYQPTQKYLDMLQDASIMRGPLAPAQGMVQPGDYPEMTSPFEPGQEWDYRTAQKGPQGEDLPPGALGWKPSGKPYFGDNFAGWWNSVKSTLTEAITYRETLSKRMDEDEDISLLTPAKELGGLTLDLLWRGIANPAYTLAEDIIQRPFTTASMNMEDLAEPSSWKPLPRLSDWKYAPSFIKKDWYNVVERASPIHMVYNMARVLESWTQPDAIRGEEADKIMSDNWKASRIGWSFGAHDQQYKQAFTERVEAGEPPGLVADDMQRPWAQFIGEGVFDAFWVWDKIAKGIKAARTIEASKDILKPVEEVMGIVSKHADEASGVLRGSGVADELVEATLAAKERIVNETIEKATDYGFFKPLASNKRTVATIEAANTGMWYMGYANNADEALDIFKYTADMVSGNPRKQKEAVVALWNMMPTKEAKEAIFSEGSIKLGIMMNEILGDGTKLADEFLELQKLGDANKLWQFIAGKMDDVIEKTYPLLKDIVKEEGNISPIMRWLGKREAGLAGKTKNVVRSFSGRVFIGMNPGVAVRGGIYDLFQSIADTDISIITKMPNKWAEIATKWSGGIEPASLTKGFSKTELKKFNTLIEKETGYKDLPSYLETLKGSKDLGLLDRLTMPAGRILQRLEISSSQRIVGKAMQDAMHKILKTDKALPSIDDLIKAGLPEKTAGSLVNRILDNYGDVAAVRNDVLGQLSKGAVDAFANSGWIPDEVQNILKEFGVMDEVLDVIKSGRPLDEIVEELKIIKQDLIKKAERVAQQHPDPMDNESGELIADLYKALDDGDDVQDIKDYYKGMITIGRESADAWRDVGDILFRSVDVKFRNSGFFDVRTYQQSEWFQRLHKLVQNIDAPHVQATEESRLLSDAISNIADKYLHAKGEKVAEFKKIIEAKLGVSFPETLSRKELRSMMWNIMYEQKRYKYFNPARQAAKTTFDQMVETVAAISDQAGINIDDIIQQLRNGDAYKHAMHLENKARILQDAVIIDGELKPIAEYVQSFVKLGENKEALMALGKYSGVSDNENMMKWVLGEGGIEFDDLENVDLSKAFDAFQEWRQANLLPVQADSLEELLERGGRLTDEATNAVVKKIENGAALTQDEARKYAREVAEKLAKSEELNMAERQFYQNYADEVEQVLTNRMLGATDEVASIVPSTVGNLTEATNIVNRRYDIEAAFDTMITKAKANYGKVDYIDVSDELVGKLEDWFTIADSRVNDARTMARSYAQATRDFVLHDYTKRYGFDLALSYLFNFHFWPSRTAYKWLTDRIWRQPGLVSAYMDYREAMERAHADSPKWWKYAINTNEILGLNMDNPIMFRAENIIQPIYFMAGSDFTDDKKRVNWWSTLMDDIGKVAPGYWNPLIQYGIATLLKSKQEDEAAARWAGRSIPATGLVKSITSLIGMKGGRGVEIDPSINIFSGGLGPHERDRVAKTLASFIKTGRYPEADVLEAAFTHEGPIWEEATAEQIQQYAVGNLISSFGGINTRVRTKTDLEIDTFWADYMKMWGMAPMMTPDELRISMERMRESYPFMDTLLLSRKASEERDRAYAYNVLARVKPGKTDDMAAALGMPYDMLQKFYESKGNMTEWKDSDKERFMSAIVDLGATLDLPTATTRREWMAASMRYSQMMAEGEQLFGEDVWDLEDQAYTQREFSINGEEAFRDFIDQHPRLAQAKEWKTKYILSDRLLSAYYGSLDKLRGYYKGEMYEAIENELGADIWDKWTIYWSMRNTGQNDAAKQYYKDNNLSQYGDLKKAYMEQVEEKILEYGQDLPEGKDMRLREPSEDMSIGEGQLRDYLSQPQTNNFTIQEWTQIIGEQETMLVLQEYEGLSMPSDIRDYIEQKANSMGMTYDELLISIGGAQ